MVNERVGVGDRRARDISARRVGTVRELQTLVWHMYTKMLKCCVCVPRLSLRPPVTQASYHPPPAKTTGLGRFCSSGEASSK